MKTVNPEIALIAAWNWKKFVGNAETQNQNVCVITFKKKRKIKKKKFDLFLQ